MVRLSITEGETGNKTTIVLDNDKNVKRCDILYYFGSFNNMNNELGFKETGTYKGHAYSKEEWVERLQTVPDNYTLIDGIKKKERYEALGNGWTVDVIAHIFSFLKWFYR